MQFVARCERVEVDGLGLVAALLIERAEIQDAAAREQRVILNVVDGAGELKQGHCYLCVFTEVPNES